MPEQANMINIPTQNDLWSRCITVHSLVIIGSKEKDGNYNMAPKHLAMPLGFGPYFGFMGTPQKSTYQNVMREKEFTVSYPRPDQLVVSSLLASRREPDARKPVVKEVPTISAVKVDAKLLKDAYLQLECKLRQSYGEFDEWEIITGEVVAAYIHKDALRKTNEDLDNEQLIAHNPVLAYLHPDRFHIIEQSNTFPYPTGFKR